MIEDFIDSASGMLETASATMFGSIVSGLSTTFALAATIAIAMIGVNVIMQWRPLSPTQAIAAVFKLMVISYIGLNWSNFSTIAYAVRDGMDSIGGGILETFSAESGDVSSSLGGAMDDFISDFMNRANTALEPLNWMAGAFMRVLISFLLALIAAVTALALIFSQAMVAIHVAIAPIFIGLWIFDSTKDYFAKWLQSTLSYMLYPVVIAAVFGGILSLVQGYVASISTSTYETISDFLPFLTCLIVMLVVLFLIPFIVNSLSGMIMAPGPMKAALHAAGSGLLAGRIAGGMGRAVASSPVGQAAAQVASPLTSAAAGVHNRAFAQRNMNEATAAYQRNARLTK